MDIIDILINKSSGKYEKYYREISIHHVLNGYLFENYQKWH